jgi:hypothetical protein
MGFITHKGASKMTTKQYEIKLSRLHKSIDKLNNEFFGENKLFCIKCKKQVKCEISFGGFDTFFKFKCECNKIDLCGSGDKNEAEQEARKSIDVWIFKKIKELQK